MPPGGIPPGVPPHGGYRGDGRYGGGAGEWPRDGRMDYPPDYRRSTNAAGGVPTGPPGDYDRRPPPPT